MLLALVAVTSRTEVRNIGEGRLRRQLRSQPDDVLLPRQVNQSCVGHLGGAWAGSRKPQEAYWELTLLLKKMLDLSKVSLKLYPCS